jgi:hypothetical protein
MLVSVEKLEMVLYPLQWRPLEGGGVLPKI